MTTVNEFAATYLEQHCKAKESWRDDCRRLNRRILPVLGHLELSEIRMWQVDRLHSSMREAPYEANRVLELIHNMFEKALQWEFVPRDLRNPAQDVESFPEYSRDVWIKEHEMPKVLAEINNLKDNRHRVALLMILATGSRIEEMFCLKWRDVDFKAGQIHLRRKNTKTQQMQIIPITPYIEELLNSLKRESEYVFPSRESKTGHLTTLGDTWRGIRKRAGVEEVQLKDLRSTAASWVVNDNVSLYTVQRMLNHTSPRCTQRYAKLQTEPVRVALTRYHENLTSA